MIWTEHIQVPLYLCTHSDLLSLWGVARMFQDAADNHTSAEHIGYADLQKENKAWVLSRIHYEVYAVPAAYEQVVVQTWSRGTDGLFAVRDTTLSDAHGHVFVAATSYWVIIDMERRRVCRMHDKVLHYDHTPRQATPVTALPKLPLPEVEQTALVRTFVAPYSSIDHTRHVNNAEYIRWALDAYASSAPEGGEVDRLTAAHSLVEGRGAWSFDIHYLQETRYAEQVELRECRGDDAYDLVMQTPRGLSAVCRIARL
ncbi:MAG: hypothetical protein IJV22_03610 [Bacteroidales bacterium]|nr:hypothetical protein [Bacteroidales bacterium]